MTDPAADTPEGKREGSGGLVFPVVVIITILKKRYGLLSKE